MAEAVRLFRRTEPESLDRGAAPAHSSGVILGYPTSDLRRLVQITKPDSLKVFLPGTPHNHRSPPP
jgi:hypothetical protein